MIETNLHRLVERLQRTRQSEARLVADWVKECIEEWEGAEASDDIEDFAGLLYTSMDEIIDAARAVQLWARHKGGVL